MSDISPTLSSCPDRRKTFWMNANKELSERRRRSRQESERVRGCLSQALALFPGGDEIRLSVMFPLVKGIQS